MGETATKSSLARERPAFEVRTLALVGITLLLSSCSSNLPPLPEHPNFVFILIDTLRASDLSYNGYTLETSPTLDALARESYVFENATSVGGNTPTAMAGIMTGLWPHYDFGEEWAANWFGMRRFYNHDDESGLPENVPTLAERMSSAGYVTAGHITNPYVRKGFHFDRGFDVYGHIFRDRGTAYGRGEAVTDAAVRFLRNTSGGPLFPLSALHGHARSVPSSRTVLHEIHRLCGRPGPLLETVEALEKGDKGR